MQLPPLILSLPLAGGLNVFHPLTLDIIYIIRHILTEDIFHVEGGGGGVMLV